MYSYLESLMAEIAAKALRGWNLALILFAVAGWLFIHPESHAWSIVVDGCCTIIVLVVFIDALAAENRAEGSEDQ